MDTGRGPLFSQETKKDGPGGKSWGDRARKSREFEEGAINREKCLRNAGDRNISWKLSEEWVVCMVSRDF